MKRQNMNHDCYAMLDFFDLLPDIDYILLVSKESADDIEDKEE